MILLPRRKTLGSGILYDAGAGASDWQQGYVSNGSVIFNSNNIECVANGNSYFAFAVSKNLVSLVGYTYLNVLFSSAAGGSSNDDVLLYIDSVQMNNGYLARVYHSYFSTLTNYTLTLNVSAYQGLFYIKTGGDYISSAKISKIWLSN
jgi:hypothetical protein